MDTNPYSGLLTLFTPFTFAAGFAVAKLGDRVLDVQYPEKSGDIDGQNNDASNQSIQTSATGPVSPNL